MTEPPATFGIGIGELFREGFRGYRAQPIGLTLASMTTFGVYLLFRFPARAAALEGAVVRSLLLDLAGLLLASIIALPWYSYALDADRGVSVETRKPLLYPARFQAQATASFWFWAAVLLGLRYLYGLPSILAMVFYAFFGFIIADGAADGGLEALGKSVRLTEGRRIGIFGIGALFLVFNLFGPIAIGLGINPLTVALAVAGIVVTSNVTMVAGARLYRTLVGT